MSKKVKMNERPSVERSKDFKEVNLGYRKEQAVEEAKRCIQCKKPLCIEGCPVEINIPGFIKAIAQDNMPEAVRILKDKNNLPAVCGRVCPQEEQCELKCILGKKGEPVGIGYLERFTADWERENNFTTGPVRGNNSEIKIAVVGSGPAGLTCAGDLAKAGFDVTIFESLHKPGGVLRYGIPEFRLPNDILDFELANLEKMGVKIIRNSLIGRTKSLDDLFKEGFKAIFLAVGAGLPNFMNIPGENLNNIYSANEFLVRVNLMNAYTFPEHDTPVYVGKRVAVIGGGNTAMDSARTALRLGASEVTLIYRRSKEEMPARLEEANHALEEGIKFMLLTNPVKYTGDENGFVKEIECQKMELGAPDESGRRSPKVIPNSNFTMPIDMVVIAVGLSPNPLIPSLTKGLTTNKWGELIIDDNFMTTMPGVFAGGDIVGGETVIEAMGMGKRAARAIEKYLTNLVPA
ncbi:MAG: NADPH-dependent glutamate synthase [Elusimicrobia bacterium]|nr:NADPH-dependent glutamate synthase [Candidatus Liberimonas magnetica]